VKWFHSANYIVMSVAIGNRIQFLIDNIILIEIVFLFYYDKILYIHLKHINKQFRLDAVQWIISYNTHYSL